MNPKEFDVSSDDSLLDMDWVVAQIRGAYWGSWRSDELIRRSLKSSINFGLYWISPDEGLEDFPVRPEIRQVGFARVVTDGTTHHYLCDVVIEERYRRGGLGTLLVSEILKHPDFKTGVMTLGTRDAHGFYEKFGFVRCEQMKRIPPH